MDTQNHGLEYVTPFKVMVFFGIYVGFLGCKDLIRQLECFSKSINEEIFTEKNKR